MEILAHDHCLVRVPHGNSREQTLEQTVDIMSQDVVSDWGLTVPYGMPPLPKSGACHNFSQVPSPPNSVTLATKPLSYGTLGGT